MRRPSSEQALASKSQDRAGLFRPTVRTAPPRRGGHQRQLASLTIISARAPSTCSPPSTWPAGPVISDNRTSHTQDDFVAFLSMTTGDLPFGPSWL